MSRDIRLKHRVSGAGIMFAAALAFLSVVMRDNSGEIGFWAGNLLTDLFGTISLILVGLVFLWGFWLAREGGIRGRWQALAGMAIIALGFEVALGTLPGSAGRFWAGGLGIWLSGNTRAWVGMPGLILVAVCLLAGEAGWLGKSLSSVEPGGLPRECRPYYIRWPGTFGGGPSAG